MKWFKHMTDAGMDQKLMIVLDVYGAAGYGAFWLIIETIARNVDEKNTTSITFSLQNWRKITTFPPKKFRKFATFLQEISLFSVEICENHITIDCPNILKYRDEWTRKKSKNSGVAPDSYKEEEIEEEKEKEEEIEEKREKTDAADADPPSSAEDPPIKKQKWSKSKVDLLPDEEIPDFIGVELWHEWRQSRCEIKKPLTPTAEKQQISNIRKWHEEGFDIRKIIARSIANGWQGLFQKPEDKIQKSNVYNSESFRKKQDKIFAGAI